MYLHNSFNNAREEVTPAETGHFRIYTNYLAAERSEAVLLNLRLLILTDWLYRLFTLSGDKVTLLHNSNFPAKFINSQLNVLSQGELEQDALPQKYDIVIIGAEDAFTGEARYWLRCKPLVAKELASDKLSNPDEVLNYLRELGFQPLVFRYLLTHSRYYNQSIVSPDTLKSAQNELEQLRVEMLELFRLSQLSEIELGRVFSRASGETVTHECNVLFWQALNNNLDLPRTVNALWGMLKLPYAKLHPSIRLNLLFEWDAILGFGLKTYLHNGVWWSLRGGLNGGLTRVDSTVKSLAEQYFSSGSDYRRADQILEELKTRGFKLHGDWLLLPIDQT